MLSSFAFVGLMAGMVASTPLKYKIPSIMKAAGCTMPSEYAVSGFSAYTDRSNQTTIAFSYVDSATGLSSHCERNATSKPSLSNRYACDNSNVEFIYQTTGLKGLTVIEAACPESNASAFEASALVPFTLVCSNSTTTTGQNCTSNPAEIKGEFTSLQPRPVGAFSHA